MPALTPETATVYVVAEADPAGFDDMAAIADSSADAISSSYDTAGASAAAAIDGAADSIDTSLARTAAAGDAAGESLATSFDSAGAAIDAAGAEMAATATEATAAAGDSMVDTMGSAGMVAGAALHDGVTDGAEDAVDDVGKAGESAGAALTEGTVAGTADMADQLASVGVIAGTQMGGAVKDGVSDLGGDLAKTGETSGAALSTGLKAGSKEAATTLSNVGKWGALAAAGVAVASIKMATDWQASMTALVTGAGQSKAGLSEVSSGLLDMAGQVGASTKQLAAGMYLVESAGFHGAQGLSVMKAAAEGAKVGSATLASVANVVTSALNAYGESGKTATKVTNELVSIVASGKMHMQTLATAVANVLPVAASAKVSFTQVGGAIATMTSQGMTARRASTDLADMLRAFLKPSSDASAEMQKLGLTANKLATSLGQNGITGTLDEMTTAVLKSTSGGDVMATGFENMTPAAKQVAEAILSGKESASQLATAITALPPKQAKLVSSFETSASSATGLKQTFDAAMGTMVGGAAGLNVALLLSGTHATTFAGNVKTIGDAARNTSETVRGFATVQDDLGFQLDSVKDSAEALSIKFGDVLVPMLEDALHSGEEVVGWLDHNKLAAEALAAAVGGVLATAIGVFAVNKITSFASSLKSAVTDVQKFGHFIGTMGQKLFGLNAPTSAAVADQAELGAASDSASAQIAAAAATDKASMESVASSSASASASLDGSFEEMGAASSAAAAEMSTSMDGAAASVNASAISAEGGMEGMAASAAGGEEGLGAVTEGASGMLGPIGLAAGAIGGLLVPAFIGLFNSGPSAAQATEMAVTALNKTLDQIPDSNVAQLAVKLGDISTKANAAAASLAKMTPASSSAQVEAGKLADLHTQAVATATATATLQGNTATLGSTFGLTNSQVTQYASQAGVNLKKALDPTDVKAFVQALKTTNTAFTSSKTSSTGWAAAVSTNAANAVDQVKTQTKLLVTDTRDKMILEQILMTGGGAIGIAAFANSLKGGLPTVISLNKQIGTEIPTQTMQVFESVMGKGGQVSIQKLTEMIRSGTGTTAAAARSMVTTVKTTAGKLKTGMNKVGSDSTQALIAAIEAADPNISTAARKVLVDATTAMSAHKTDGKSVGTAIAQGIASGLLSETSAVSAAAAAVVTKAVEAAKAKATIKSPSQRAAREIGLPLVQGIAQGITDNAHLVSSAMAAAVGITSPHLAPSSAAAVASMVAAGGSSNPSAIGGGAVGLGAGAGAGAMNIYLTLNVSAPSATPRKMGAELAPIIREELLQMKRSLGGPTRSTSGLGLG